MTLNFHFLLDSDDLMVWFLTSQLGELYTCVLNTKDSIWGKMPTLLDIKKSQVNVQSTILQNDLCKCSNNRKLIESHAFSVFSNPQIPLGMTLLVSKKGLLYGKAMCHEGDCATAGPFPVLGAVGKLSRADCSPEKQVSMTKLKIFKCHCTSLTISWWFFKKKKLFVSNQYYPINLHASIFSSTNISSVTMWVRLQCHNKFLVMLHFMCFSPLT